MKFIQKSTFTTHSNDNWRILNFDGDLTQSRHLHYHTQN